MQKTFEGYAIIVPYTVIYLWQLTSMLFIAMYYKQSSQVDLLAEIETPVASHIRREGWGHAP